MGRIQETRWINIHKKEKSQRFTQIDFETLGTAMGKLEKKGSKNIYLYLASNKDKFNFEFKVANYATWLGESVFDENGQSLKTPYDKYTKQVREGIAELTEKGYLVEEPVGSKVYHFYVEGINDEKSIKRLEVVETTNSRITDEDFLTDGQLNNQKSINLPEVVETTVSQLNDESSEKTYETFDF